MKVRKNSVAERIIAAVNGGLWKQFTALEQAGHQVAMPGVQR